MQTRTVDTSSRGKREAFDKTLEDMLKLSGATPGDASICVSQEIHYDHPRVKGEYSNPLTRIRYLPRLWRPSGVRLTAPPIPGPSSGRFTSLIMPVVRSSSHVSAVANSVWFRHGESLIRLYANPSEAVLTMFENPLPGAAQDMAGSMVVSYPSPKGPLSLFWIARDGHVQRSLFDSTNDWNTQVCATGGLASINAGGSIQLGVESDLTHIWFVDVQGEIKHLKMLSDLQICEVVSASWPQRRVRNSDPICMAFDPNENAVYWVSRAPRHSTSAEPGIVRTVHEESRSAPVNGTSTSSLVLSNKNEQGLEKRYRAFKNLVVQPFRVSQHQRFVLWLDDGVHALHNNTEDSCFQIAPGHMVHERSGLAVAANETGDVILAVWVAPSGRLMGSVWRCLRLDWVDNSHFQAWTVATLGQDLYADLDVVRPYLGKAMQSYDDEAFSLRNFPIALDALNALEIDVANIARAMGKAYAVLQWGAGANADDVEFVLGTTLGSTGQLQNRAVHLWLLDFGQCEFVDVEAKNRGIYQWFHGALVTGDNQWFIPHCKRDKVLFKEFRDGYIEAGNIILVARGLADRFNMEEFMDGLGCVFKGHKKQRDQQLAWLIQPRLYRHLSGSVLFLCLSASALHSTSPQLLRSGPLSTLAARDRPKEPIPDQKGFSSTRVLKVWNLGFSEAVSHDLVEHGNRGIPLLVSPGKQLVSLFKEAKASYEEKKAQLKPEPRPLQRAQTFDHSQPTPRRISYDDYYQDDGNPNYYYDDGHSEASSRRSHNSRASRPRSHRDIAHRPRPALTESNLKTLSEVSSVTPSRAPPPPPAAYRSPYAETLPRDMALSKMDLNHEDIRGLGHLDRRHSFEVPRAYPESQYSAEPGRPPKEIDMDLAYGNIPPDLASRWDLDPVYQERSKADKARALVRRVEGLLTEANCVQHSAGAIIKNLQEKPDSAAAVALTLAELSTAVSKVSPAVLGLLKGGSPAVFGLLASPHFLVGTTIAVGVTAVMFGGWKIVKKVNEAKAAREALALEGVPMDRPAPLRTQTEVSAGFDEAFVLEEELSTIETWRRGIQPTGADDESADYELITPEAGRALYGKDDFDLKSRRSVKTTKTSKTTKTHKSSKSKREDKAPSEHGSSSRRGPASEAGSERSRKSSSSRRRETKTIEDGRSRRGDDETDMVIRPRAQRQSSNMLKAIFKNKKEKERSNDLVLA
ncbi:hypothetical protein HJFPF1_09974 [Paramyrothecium foliicola]|nr:hypothetical protein HJFPF1_09974 [Paramyrothecium foliicola]